MGDLQVMIRKTLEEFLFGPTVSYVNLIGSELTLKNRRKNN